jgi:hypothetical protein
LFQPPKTFLDTGHAGDGVRDHAAGDHGGGTGGRTSGLADDLVLLSFPPGQPVLNGTQAFIDGFLQRVKAGRGTCEHVFGLGLEIQQSLNAAADGL